MCPPLSRATFRLPSVVPWLQEIVVGFRTPSGVITTTQTFKTIELPRQVRGKPGGWNPLVCLEWADRFLNSIKGIGQAPGSENASRSVWRASFVPGTGVNVRLLGQSEVDEVVNMEDRIGFLPRWYWSEVQAQPGRPVSDTTQSTVQAMAPPPATHSGWQI